MTPISRIGCATTIFAVVVALGGCAVSLDRLPLPAPGLGDGSYSLTVTFGNALNLPTKAKVKLNGADIGQVESMAAKDYTAVVQLRIRDGVALPVGTGAELRSATPMGDVFVAMKPPAEPPADGAVLRDGAAIPVESTSAAATIEEVLSRASLLVGGGAIENITQVITALGEYTDGRGDRLAALLTRTRELLTTLAGRSDRIHTVLTDTAALSATVAAQQPAIGDAVASAAPALGVVGDNIDALLDLVDRVHAISMQLSRFPSIQGTNHGSMIADLDALAAGMNAAALNPEADLATLNSVLPIVLKVTTASSANVRADIVQLALGAAPDPNFPGDPAARPPDITDWHAFVGSLGYMLQRLGGRVHGAPR
ncbi:MlaD family protein [Nocardia sp. NPDC024068]|uniref:MlaD family protein n=1 Tax=Nocardia sp. NPDC024068 TaxID=3157197 RepID=UPI0034053014